LAELLGKSTGTNKGKGGRGHISEPSAGFFGAHAVVGGNLSIAAGVALARQLDKDEGIVVVMFGDGASGAGALHETLNIAALWALPILFACNNNQLSVSTSRRAALAPQKISDLAGAYGVEGQTVDGMDLDAVAGASRAYAAAIRQGGGPRFLECVSHRFSSHSTTARETRSPKDLKDIRLKCPINAYSARLLKTGDLAPSSLEKLEDEVAETVRTAITFAEASPFPDAKDALLDVY
jgi:pyruvate dehydrogenase E1 component alpha subunit